jgi:hypothetical protein
VLRSTRSYREEEDVLGPFLADRCVFEVGARIAKGVLLKAHQQWSEENSEKPLSVRIFASRIKDLRGVGESKSGSIRVWTGIRVRDARDTSDAVSENSSQTPSRSDLFRNAVPSVPSVPPSEEIRSREDEPV